MQGHFAGIRIGQIIQVGGRIRAKRESNRSCCFRAFPYIWTINNGDELIADLNLTIRFDII
ncbi:hypothetical protein PK34_19610 [Stutzerimonas stutzeri]|nr:hypothetical protein PK34_19610 [Stutzerimonas stutzeri]